MSDIWGTDARPSLPEPPEDRPVVLDFGGFGFSTGGIVVNVTADEIEEIYHPTYGPADGHHVQGGDE